MNLIDVTSMYNNFNTLKKCTIICCADHGVVAEGVSAYPKETTAQMVKNYLVAEGAAANVFANFAHSELLVVDVGVDADIHDLPGLVDRKIAYGTNNFTQGPAMTRAQAVKSIQIGIELVETAMRGGYDCFLPGEMGIANTTASAAITSVLLKVDPTNVTGRGTNISDERYKHKIEVVKKALAVNKLTRKCARNPIDVLAKVGGFELGCMAGIIIAAERLGALVVLDGFNTSVAALIACSLEPACRRSLIASHIGREPGHKLILDALKLFPMLRLNLALGEAIGSSIAVHILDKINSSYAYPENVQPALDFVEDDDVLDVDDVADSPFDYDEDGIEGYDIEFNIYDGTGQDMRFNVNDDAEDEPTIDVKKMDDGNISVTDRTFSFYLNTMPMLNHNAMERSQKLLDNLSKPCGSLGLLEEIVVQLAGISSEELPGYSLKRNLICYTDKVDDAAEFDENFDDEDWDGTSNPLVDVSETVEKFKTSVTFAVVNPFSDPSAAFDFGRSVAEDVSFRTPIIGISILNDVDAEEDLGEELSDILTTDEDQLKYDADEFLRHVPRANQSLVSSVIGAIIAAAHNASLVIVDTGAVDLIARYTEKLCPEVCPYILHASKLVMADVEGLDDELDGEVVCIGMEIVKAALQAANEMKSFNESGVDTAIDGVGSFRQTD